MEALGQSRILLEPPPGSRVGQRVLTGGLFVLGAYFIGLAVIDLFVYDVIMVALFVLGFLVWTAAEAMRRAHRRDVASGAIVIDGETLAVEYPPALRDPLRVPISQVRVAATDGGELDRQTPAGSEPRAFPVYESGGGTRVADHLGSDEAWIPVPSLGRAEGPRNVILLFDRLVMPPGVRKQTPHGLRQGHPTPGLALTASDPAQARRAFDAFGLQPRIREDDLKRVAALNAAEDQEAEATVSASPPNLIVLGWLAMLVSFFYFPFVEIWGLWLASRIWKQGMRFHAVLLAAVGAYILIAQVWIAAAGDANGRFFRTGAIVTLLLLAGTLLRRLVLATASPEEGARGA